MPFWFICSNLGRNSGFQQINSQCMIELMFFVSQTEGPSILTHGTLKHALAKGQHFTLYKAISLRKSTPAKYRMAGIPLKYLILSSLLIKVVTVWDPNTSKSRGTLPNNVFSRILGTHNIFLRKKGQDS